jgi:DEAD/DEAH box helicase domain-containing protein
MDARSLARENANIVLTNPDMLHTSILPSHDFWYAVLFCLSLPLIGNDML